MVISVLFVFDLHSATAWWSHGHEHITRGAIDYLPQPLRSFFERHRDYLAPRSSWEPPGSHWIHMDAYPSFFEGSFPRVYDDVVAMYGLSHVLSQGTAPWTFDSYVESLSNGMAAAANENDWIQLLNTAAAQAHFIEDLHNPFHLTSNYDGQQTGNHGIHARYEGQMIVRHLGDLTFSPAEAEYLPSVLDFVFDGIDLTFPHVEDVLAADDLYAGLPTEEYYAGMWNETGAFTHILFQRASEAVANSWYTAWIDAGSPTTFLAANGDFDFDGDTDGRDFLHWQRNPGLGPLLDWQVNYGSTATLQVTGTVLPEPTGFLLLLLLGIPMATKRRLP